MERTFRNQARRARVAFAAAAAIATLGTGAAQAQNTPSFITASITINSVGFLDCSFKETGLSAGALVTYTCGATDVGWLTQCFVHNKPVSNIPPALHVAHNVTTEQQLFASSRGTLTGGILTAYPTPAEEIGNPLCPETEGVTVTEEVTAIRWCNNSFEDATNGIPGASVPQLFLKLVRNGAGNVPDCASLASSPAIP